MAMTDEAKQRYDECRLMMNQVELNFRRIFWGHVATACVFVVLGLFAGALMAGSGDHHGSGIWYFTMEAGLISFGFGLLTFVLGFFAGAKSRAAGWALLFVFAAIVILSLIPQLTTISASNVLPAGIGILLSVWQLTQFGKLGWLEEQPGYPLFSVRASEPAEYEAPLYVKMHQATSGEMDTVGGAPVQSAPHKSHADAALPAADAAAFGIAEMQQTTHAPHASEAALQAAENLTLASFEAAAGQSGSAQTAPAAPASPADLMLSEMKATGSATHKNYAPDESVLESPEAVRARLAAMKNGTDKS